MNSLYVASYKCKIFFKEMNCLRDAVAYILRLHLTSLNQDHHPAVY